MNRFYSTEVIMVTGGSKEKYMVVILPCPYFSYSASSSSQLWPCSPKQTSFQLWAALLQESKVGKQQSSNVCPSLCSPPLVAPLALPALSCSPTLGLQGSQWETVLCFSSSSLGIFTESTYDEQCPHQDCNTSRNQLCFRIPYTTVDQLSINTGAPGTSKV